MKQILVVEDDKMLNSGLCYDLEAEGYLVQAAYTVKQGLKMALEKDYDLIVLDVNLPDGSGFSLCRELKESRDTPVIFLTANDLEADQAKGFDLGADDYITKPFQMPLFRRRARAVLKRSGKSRQNLFDDGYLLLDFDGLKALKKGEPLTLTPTEFKLLNIFISNNGIVLTRQVLLERIWDLDGNFVDEHALTVNINRLRSKLEDDSHKYIKTVYGMGYQWEGRTI